MPTEPKIEGLSQRRRQVLFLFLVLVFVVSLPVMIFYTTGYRLSFDNDKTSIITTGGLYVTTDNLEVEVYLDEEKIEKPRLFRSAYYIQNIEAGKHLLVVQRPDLQTWVKELPVDSHIVIEVAAFNMPVIPHIRPITKYTTERNLPVFKQTASTTIIFPEATTTTPLYATTSLATSSYQINEEFAFVESLFASSSVVLRSVFEPKKINKFQFATSSQKTVSTSPEALKQRGDLSLKAKDDQLFAVWNDDVSGIPHYFCVTEGPLSSTAARYGQHVADSIFKLSISSTTPLLINGDRVCRPEVQLNRLQQDVFFYDFFPDSQDLILLQLEDGLYVTEIDDRAWQNTQLLYPGNNFIVVVENGVIYIKEEGVYFEVIIEIEPPE